MTDSCFNRVADLEKDSDVSECFRIAILLNKIASDSGKVLRRNIVCSM